MTLSSAATGVTSALTVKVRWPDCFCFCHSWCDKYMWDGVTVFTCVVVTLRASAVAGVTGKDGMA